MKDYSLEELRELKSNVEIHLGDLKDKVFEYQLMLSEINDSITR